MKALLVSIFGTYTPQMVSEYHEIVVDGVETLQEVQVVGSGLSGLDIQWIAGVVLFGIVLYCLLRMIGGIFK